jgi:acetylornithine deacetylase
LLRQLVAFDTTSARSNLPLVDFASELLDRPGVRLWRNVCPLAVCDCPSCVTGRQPGAAAKANLIALMGPDVDDTRTGLTLSGHTDVVPAGEPGWRGDPFVLREDDGRLIGRGAADMKGFLALTLALVGDLDLGRLRRPLALLFTFDEEVGTIGAQHFVRTWDHVAHPLPRQVLIGEPTELRVVRLHKGHLKLRVTLTGRAAHSGYPHLGASAIEAAGPAIAALGALRDELARERVPASVFFPEVPHAPVNLGRIQGGSAINVVAETCVLELGIRLLPGMADAPFVARATAAVDGAMRHAPAGVTARVDLLSSSPPMECRADAPLHRALCAMMGQPASASVMYASDGGPLQALDLDTVIWGPGSIAVAHRPEEWMPRAELERAAPLLRRLVDQFCLDPEES